MKYSGICQIADSFSLYHECNSRIMTYLQLNSQCISFYREQRLHIYSCFFSPPRYGFSNMRYIASLISGVGIFMMGAGLSWYHGIMGLLNPQPIESLLWVSVCVDSSLSVEAFKCY